MQDTSHFEVQGLFEHDDNDENERIDLNFRNIDENFTAEILQHSFCEGIQQMIDVKKLNEIRVYRKTLLQEIKKVIENRGFSADRSETWISECFDKILKYQNNGIPMERRSEQRILQLVLNKKNYDDFRCNDVVPQFRSKGAGKSVFNYEGIPDGACQSKASTVSPTVKKNIGINKNHVGKFNQSIKSINVLDPDDPCVKNRFLRYVSENKFESFMIVISVIYEIKELILILTDKNGETIQKLTVHILEKAIDQIGSCITSVLAALLPGIGSFVIGVLVAPGEGPPKSDYFSLVYGSNSCFGEPLNEYNLQDMFGIPKSDDSSLVYGSNSYSGEPLNEYNLQGMFGIPKSDYNY
ncbi:unnamed protein product [Rotaria socialis]|uniref:Uncharacterized protein n=1 Tax=Rotaria socialis TaxID=392032 RepID=A0A820DEG4_9BILA|nr:unnamed protein product [Rotaria socialis]CAF3513170.1 unnamed protein product [Rotaria socialis]CAF3703648.1 unnamed protein product [Rotaria socialis]CAF4230677.1 unnamed protein product [Rotaria socialis]CAF4520807.1 unnamed protein product [Rotaria socialis]